MSDFYADSSVLVKRHISEAGSAWFRALADLAIGTTIITAQISVVEVISAFKPMVLGGFLTETCERSMVRMFSARTTGGSHVYRGF